MSILTYSATVIAALGAGLMGGFFFAFSNLVMASLGRLAPDAGITAMQTINVVVQNPVFFIGFFGTAAFSLALAVVAVMNLANPGMVMLLVASLLYLVCIIAVTVAFNVPMNEALAQMDATSAAAAGYWAEYLQRWTMWNHIRTIGGLASSGVFILAARAAI